MIVVIILAQARLHSVNGEKGHAQNVTKEKKRKKQTEENKYGMERRRKMIKCKHGVEIDCSDDNFEKSTFYWNCVKHGNRAVFTGFCNKHNCRFFEEGASPEKETKASFTKCVHGREYLNGGYYCTLIRIASDKDECECRDFTPKTDLEETQGVTQQGFEKPEKSSHAFADLKDFATVYEEAREKISSRMTRSILADIDIRMFCFHVCLELLKKEGVK